MNNSELTPNNLKSQFDTKLIQEATVIQLNKDFSLAGLDLNLQLGSQNAYYECMSKICPIIENLLTNDIEKFKLLLYTLDISLAKIKINLIQKSDLHIVEASSHLIIERCLQKVNTKIAFRKSKE